MGVFERIILTYGNSTNKFLTGAVLKITGISFTFLLTLIISNSYGASFTGFFFKNLSIVLGLRIVILFGANHLIVKYSSSLIYERIIYQMIRRSIIIYIVICFAFFVYYYQSSEAILFNNTFSQNLVLVVSSLLYAFPLFLSEIYKASGLSSKSIIYEGFGLPVAYVFCTLLFVVIGLENLEWVLFISGAMISIFSIAGLRRHPIHISKSALGRSDNKNFIISSYFLFGMSVSSYLYNGLDIVLISHLVSDSVSGEYVIHKKVAQLLLFLVVVNTSVNSSKVLKLVGEGHASVKQFILKNMQFMAVLAIGLASVLFFLGRFYISNLISDVETNTFLLTLLLLTQSLNVVTSLLGPVLIYLNKEKLVSIVFVATSVFSLLFIFPLTEMYSLYGTALAIFITLFLQKAILLILLMKK